MIFRNFTPFPALAYQALDQNSALYHVVALRQTLAVSSEGAVTYPDEQLPLLVADEYFGEVNRSSVKQESDLVPFKPKCDVIVIATAYAPGGHPAKRFPVNIRISSTANGRPTTILDKTLNVTGARSWRKHPVFFRWELTNPEPMLKLPLQYEHAFGGELKIPNLGAQQKALDGGGNPENVPPLRHAALETNPVGRGYIEDWFIDETTVDRIPAPQIESPLFPVQKFGEQNAVEGFGVIAKSWLPRRALCGTADEVFAKSESWLPKDFDFAFWNGAHPDLQLPYLVGNETIELTNLTPEGKLLLHLPDHRPYVLVRYTAGEIAPAELNIDTVVIDTEEMKLSIVSRLMISTEPEVRALEARLITRQQRDAALTHAAPEILHGR